jgi:hypothetical protein
MGAAGFEPVGWRWCCDGHTGPNGLSLVSADTFSASQTVMLTCSDATGSVTTWHDPRVWAIKTGNLHATLPIPLD